MGIEGYIWHIVDEVSYAYKTIVRQKSGSYNISTKKDLTRPQLFGR